LGKRRNPRIQARLQVRIAGSDANGRPLLQMDTTHNVSWQGALLDGIQAELKSGETIAVTYKNNKARFRVVWVGNLGTTQAGKIGIESLDAAKCIWDVAILFPPVPDTYTAPAPKKRRKHRRLSCKLGAELHIEGAKALVRGQITDISEGGCFFAMSTLPNDQSRLKLMFRANNSKVTINGIVVSRRPGFGISIRFTEMTEAVREHLRSFFVVPPGLLR
jgi:hypothetical protein